MFLFVVAIISVPSEVSVSEGDGTVEVCATLSGVSSSDPLISVMLSTTPGITTGVCIWKLIFVQCEWSLRLV